MSEKPGDREAIIMWLNGYFRGLRDIHAHIVRIGFDLGARLPREDESEEGLRIPLEFSKWLFASARDTLCSMMAGAPSVKPAPAAEPQAGVSPAPVESAVEFRDGDRVRVKPMFNLDDNRCKCRGFWAEYQGRSGIVDNLEMNKHAKCTNPCVGKLCYIRFGVDKYVCFPTSILESAGPPAAAEPQAGVSPAPVEPASAVTEPQAGVSPAPVEPAPAPEPPAGVSPAPVEPAPVEPASAAAEPPAEAVAPPSEPKFKAGDLVIVKPVKDKICKCGNIYEVNVGKTYRVLGLFECGGCEGIKYKLDNPNDVWFCLPEFALALVEGV